ALRGRGGRARGPVRRAGCRTAAGGGSHADGSAFAMPVRTRHARLRASGGVALARVAGAAFFAAGLGLPAGVLAFPAALRAGAAAAATVSSAGARRLPRLFLSSAVRSTTLDGAA